MPTNPSNNPFHIGERVSGENFADREEEVARIREAMLSASSLLVYGPRRMGKSSTIHNAAESARSARPKPIIVSADVATATNLFDVSARLLRSLYQETRWLKLRLEDLLGGLAPRVTVRLDEFQAVRSFAGESSEWHLRDVMQRHGDLGYVCAGSQESLIHGMIGPKRAFYKMFELLPLGPIDPRFLAGWIDERLARGGRVEPGVGMEVVRRAGPRTQDVIQVARQLYFRALAAGRTLETADVVAALDEVVYNEGPLIRSLWNGLSAQQQDVLRVVALGVEQLYSAETRDLYGLPGASSVHKAVETLIGRGLLVRDGERVEFDSPFFLRWVRREVAVDLG